MVFKRVSKINFSTAGVLVYNEWYSLLISGLLQKKDSVNTVISALL